MGKVMDKAIRIGHEKDWHEFAKFHPEIMIFFDNDNIAIDAEFISSKISNATIHIVDGKLESVFYIFDGYLVEYPPSKK